MEGPCVYFAKGKELTVESINMDYFAGVHKGTIGCYVTMTPNAFMRNEVWLAIIPSLCNDIRAIKGMKNYPNLWVVLSLDGFGSHMVGQLFEIFTKCKILVIKEEGDISQVLQAYDQFMANSDKNFTRGLLDEYRYHTKGVINQFQLILTINAALNSLDCHSWVKSFICVNRCLLQHVSFTTWIKNHKASVSAADRFFTN